MEQGCKDIATRLRNAQNSFVDEVMEQFNVSRVDAVTVLNEFRKAKVIKMDVGVGQFKLKYGGLWDADVIKRAIEIGNSS